jgi:hypothetical protein
MASEHERDAMLGAFSAWAAIHKPEAWIDLFADEGPSFTPITAPLHYMMPLPAAQQLAEADSAGARKG